MSDYRIGYHASHEQFAPSALLQDVIHAREAGFNAAMCSDHLFPWGQSQKHSGFAWSWLGAALHAADPLPFGVVNAPGYRYNPVIIAQAAATLGEMFRGRFWVAIGSGEYMNEHITGEPWPPKQERNARLKECADIMRALWAGEMVTHRGLVTVVEAHIYSLPETPVRLVGAAITPETAAWMAPWVDALITALQPPEKLRQVVAAFRENGGEGKALILQEKVSYAATDDEAVKSAHDQWRTNILESGPLAQLALPSHFDAAAAFVRPEDVAGRIHCSCSLEQHAEWILDDVQLGFDEVYIHNVNLEQKEFIDAFGADVLPVLRRHLTGGSHAA